ncbi:MAG: PKD domain-containing protein, partial [Planctomycetes bacterium]|nr:PKD domain-containing protein [Planctomycetota bacterium]
MTRHLSISVLIVTLVLIIAQVGYACNIAPIAALSADPQYVVAGNSVELDGSGSYDSDGTITKCEWDWTNNGSYDYTETPDDKKATHTYNTVGTYTAKIRVTDNGSLTDTDTVTVYVKPSTYYVKTDGDDSNNGQSWAQAFATIQKGIDSVDGEGVVTVLVAEGTYEETVDFKGKDDIVLSNYDPNDVGWDVVEATIIDANSWGPAVTFSGLEDSSTKLTGFTITGGHITGVEERHAHWAFDANAADVYWNYNGTLQGDASITTTQNEYIIGSGALSLDGTGDYVSTPSVLDPADGPFSAFAWVKSDEIGATVRAILSQNYGTGTSRLWLHTNINGYLNAQLRVAGGSGLNSTYSGHTDGQWHHVGVVYDGKRRHLYADGVVILSDSSDLSGSLESCDGGLHIGANQPDPPTAFWNGKIDDVRVYTRALSVLDVKELYNSNDVYLGGGGIRGNGATAEISECLIKDNYTNNHGGGIFNADGLITRCKVMGNTAQYGGGLSDCMGIIRNSFIVKNTASQYGGGLNGCGSILSCTIADNTAFDAGGLEDCFVDIINCIVWGNDPNQFYNCVDPNYSCIQDWEGGGYDNITLNPKFVDPANDNYHLNVYSPCIDENMPTSGYTWQTDIDGDDRVVNSKIDIGADEVYDSDGDGVPDYVELQLGLDPTYADDGEWDFDRDGLSNSAEIQAGTDLNDV